jgi:protein FAM32A
VEDHRTPAEKKYHEQKAKLEAQRLVKVASKSHRQRVEEFNQYLANLSEHYDIPKVGPG